MLRDAIISEEKKLGPLISDHPHHHHHSTEYARYNIFPSELSSELSAKGAKRGVRHLQLLDWSPPDYRPGRPKAGYGLVAMMMLFMVMTVMIKMFTEAMLIPVQRLLPRHVIHCKYDLGQLIWQRKIARRFFSSFHIVAESLSEN